MAPMQRRVAQSLAEFIQVVEGLTPTTSSGLWFRGQSKCEHRLIPSALRNLTPTTDGRGLPILRDQIVRADGGQMAGISAERMLANFKRQARPYIDHQLESEFEWMFLAQHHGLPTRLLDWTTNALVALYFAASGAQTAEGKGTKACKRFMDPKQTEYDHPGFAIFAIDPGAFNEEAGFKKEPIDLCAEPDKWSHYLRPTENRNADTPICVTAAHVTPRIRSQSGVFTLHGSNVWPLDYYEVFRPMITMIFVPYTATKKIVDGLARVGVNRSFIYPGLDSIADDVHTAERIRHEANLDAYFRKVEKGLAKSD